MTNEKNLQENSMFLNPPQIMLFIGEIAGLLRLEDGTSSKG